MPAALLVLLVLAACGSPPRAVHAAHPAPAASPNIYRYGLAEASTPSPPRGVSSRPSPSPPSDLLAQVNADRHASGLGRLVYNTCLASVARDAVGRLAAGRLDSSWNGSARDAACNLNDPQNGEVGGYWTGGVDAVSLNRLILGSASDRDTILFQWYCCAGYAWAVGAHGYGYAVIEFG